MKQEQKGTERGHGEMPQQERRQSRVVAPATQLSKQKPTLRLLSSVAPRIQAQMAAHNVRFHGLLVILAGGSRPLAHTMHISHVGHQSAARATENTLTSVLNSCEQTRACSPEIVAMRSNTLKDDTDDAAPAEDDEPACNSRSKHQACQRRQGSILGADRKASGCDARDARRPQLVPTHPT